MALRADPHKSKDALKITISTRRALTNDLDAFIHSGCTLILRLNCLAFGKRFVGQDMAQTISTV